LDGLGGNGESRLNTFTGTGEFGYCFATILVFRRESSAAIRSSLFALDIRLRYAPTSDLILALGSGLILFLGIMRVTSDEPTSGLDAKSEAVVIDALRRVAKTARW